MFTKLHRAAALLALALAFGATPSAWADVTLRVGYLRTQGYIADFPLAKVALPNVKLELVPLETGNDVLEALNARAIDVGETGEVQPIFAQAGNRPIRVIASTAPQPAATAILVRDASPIRSPADLKGKKISFVRGTNTHWLLLQTLEKAGLRQSDVTPVLLAGPDTLAALKAGSLDVAILTAPNIQIARKQGARVLVDGTGLVNSSLFYLADTSTIAGEKRPALDAFVQALALHLQWIAAHLQERADFLAPKYGIPRDTVLDASGVMTDRLAPLGDGKLVAYTQRVADAFHEQKLIPARLDVRQEFDASFDRNIPK